MAIVLTT